MKNKATVIVRSSQVNEAESEVKVTLTEESADNGGSLPDVVDASETEEVIVDASDMTILTQDACVQQHKWNHETIILLLNTYREKYSCYSRPRKLWLAMAEEFRKNGYDVTDEECSRKWSNLKTTYKRIQENNKDLRKRVIKWPYYQKIDEILNKSVMNTFDDPTFVTFLLNSVKKNKSTVVIPSSQTNEAESGVTVTLMEETAEVDNTESSIAPDAVDAPEVTEIEAKEVNNETVDADMTTLETETSMVQDDGSTELFEHRFVWNYPAVADLLSLVRAKQDKFANPMIKRKNIWREIGTAMFEKGYPVTSHYCEKKWRNLRGTYKAIVYKCQKNPNAKKNWEYFNDLHEICKDDPTLHSFGGGSSLNSPGGSQPTTIRVVSAGGATYHIIEQPRPILSPVRRTKKTQPRIESVSSLNAKALAAVASTSSISSLSQSTSGLKRKAPPSSSSEPDWFLAFKKEIRDTNERTLKELRTMHDENLRVLKQRNQIIKSLVLTLIAQNKADMDAEEANLLDEVTKALSTQVT